MRTLIWFSLIFLLACAENHQNDGRITARVLEFGAALPVDVPEQVEPSGLVMRNDSLFTISDDHDHTIFHVDFDLSENTAALHPFINFNAPNLPESGHLDFEGITTDTAGNFYLVSESAFRILKVSPGGTSVEWVTPNLKSYGDIVGLFQKKNANFEGLSTTDGVHFTLCAEREPRGIMQLNLNDMPGSITAIKQDYAVIPSKGKRTPDYVGLSIFGSTIYCLERGIHAVTELQIEHGKIKEKSLWTFAHVENDPRWKYADMEYGHAEGLLVNKDFVYIILDNNGDGRQSDVNDRRPLLFIFLKPEK